ncbi:MAG: hypothetical protein O2809_05595 [Proteobacteria bacterium]|nr:hypothetical protein [Pseudomonadota bacterium]
MYPQKNNIKFSHYLNPELLKKPIGYVAAKNNLILSLQGITMVMSKEVMSKMIKEQWPNHNEHHAKCASFGEIMDCLEEGATCFVDEKTKKTIKIQLNQLGLSHHLSDKGKAIQVGGKRIKIYPLSSEYIFLPEKNNAENSIDNRKPVEMPSQSLGALYEDNFLEAIQRTKELGFSTVNFEKKDDRALSAIMPLLQSNIRHCAIEEIAFKCNIISQQIVNFIQENTGHKAFLTIGTIWKNGKDLFSSANTFDEGFIKKTIKQRSVPIDYSHHAWVTLDTMEIIDLTLDASEKLVAGSNLDNGYLVTAGHHDDIKDKFYVPMLIGSDFYEKYDNQRYRLANATLSPIFS